MSTIPPPKISRAASFPIIWVVPLIALGVGGWFGFRTLHNRGPVITIAFANGAGVEAGKTILEYKGVEAGTVERVKLMPDLEGVIVHLRLKKITASLAKEGTRFWILRPEIGFSGVRGLDTLVAGVRLNALPGDGPAATHFTGLDKIPAPKRVDSGRTFFLRSEQLGSLNSGAPVFYRQFKVGQVEASRLAEDATAVLIRIHIDAPYIDLVRVNSQFWNAGGFSFKASLFGGAELKNTSLESLIAGGVAFATPSGEPLAPVASNETTYLLASEVDKDWLKWNPKIPLKSIEGSVEPQNKPDVLNDLIKP